MTFEQQQRPRSGMAIVSLILGLLMCLGPLTGIPAIILGFIARRNAAYNPHLYRGGGMALAGMICGTLGILFTCVGSGVGFFAYNQAVTLGRARDADNAHTIVQTMLDFAMTQNNGQFPPRLATTYVGDPARYVMFSSRTEPMAQPATNNWRVFADDLDRHSDFVYIGADLNFRAPGDVIVLYSKKDAPGGSQRLVAYADGRVEWVAKSHLDAAFIQSNLSRGPMNLQPVVLDGMPPVAPPVPAALNPPRFQQGMPAGGPPPGFGAPAARFANAREAVDALHVGGLSERSAAENYLRSAPVDPAVRADVVTETVNSLSAPPPQRLNSAAELIRKWSTKDDAPLLRKALDDLLSDLSRVAMSREAAIVLIQKLAEFGDEQSIPTLVKALRNGLARNEASQALQTLGTPAEDAVLELLNDTDTLTAITAAQTLAKIGTEKSLRPLAQLKALRSGPYTQASGAFDQIIARTHADPAKYRNVLLEHFDIEGPAGFDEDTVNAPDTRQWSHTAPLRAVKSTYSVTVRMVPKTYTIRPPMGGPAAGNTMESNGLTFYQLSNTNSPPLSTVRWQALDGQYLIELSAQLDTADANARNNIPAAVKKIKVH